MSATTVPPDRAEGLVRAALAAARDATATPVERAEMLMEIAMGLQRRPRSAEQLKLAVALYDEALAICPGDEQLLGARLAARRATALQALPGEGDETIERARTAYEEVLPVLLRLGTAEEVAEAEMNLGLVLQHLAGRGRARISDAIAAYQRALRTFTAKRYPIEFAILQNNLATAFLSLPLADERGKIREALAVQSFEQGLKAVRLVDHPAEYAMLQNNLGNALQYASSSHALQNNMRAIEAYDEALRVRTRASMPLEYASTLANKANCLWTLGDLGQAQACYREALAIFEGHGEAEKARALTEAMGALEQAVGEAR
jgi:tetratricopeptide (TPR) repeat protein